MPLWDKGAVEVSAALAPEGQEIFTISDEVVVVELSSPLRRAAPFCDQKGPWGKGK